MKMKSKEEVSRGRKMFGADERRRRTTDSDEGTEKDGQSCTR